VENERTSGGGGGAPRIVGDVEVEIQSYAEVVYAFGVGQRIVESCLDRMRKASSELERDRIRAELRGFIRRLSLGMWALCFPGEPHHHTGDVK
jgi:hypothetical protein